MKNGSTSPKLDVNIVNIEPEATLTCCFYGVMEISNHVIDKLFKPNRFARHLCQWRRGGGHWSGANIAAMVLGFVVCPPLGFVVLAWTIMGRPIEDLPAWVRDKWRQFFRGGNARPHDDSDNIVFDEYQQTQYDRIHEIKEEIKNRAKAFRAFRFNARRRKDQQEFEEFMASNPEQGQGET